MKHTLIALAAAVATFGAAAQSNVSVSGTIDLAVRSVDTGAGRQHQMVRDGANSSRLRFIANEDMGGGLRANVFLDMQVRADDGTTASTFWERRSTVSLIAPWGELRLGRDGSLQNSGPGDFDALNGKGVGNTMNLSTPRNFSNAQTFARMNNAISYLLPSKLLGGLYGQVQIAPGEGANGTRNRSVGLGWRQGAVEARLTHGETDVNSVAVVNPLTGASTVQTVPRGKFIYSVLGASYDFRVARVMGSVTRWGSADALNGAGSRKQVNLNLGAMVPVGAGTFNFAVTTANRSGLGSDEQDSRQVAAQYLYNLSKRTAVFVSAARISQDALANVKDSQVNVDGTTFTGRAGTSFDIGMRHSF
jgi:predicted porin